MIRPRRHAPAEPGRALLNALLWWLRRSVMVALLTVGAVLVSSAGLLQPLSSWLDDLRFSVAPRLASGQIVLVDIRAIDRGPRLRRIQAELVRTLHQMDAARIALDADLAAAPSAADDAALEDALHTAWGRTVLASSERLPGHIGAADQLDLRSRLGAYTSPALVNVRPDRDGTVRSVPFGAVLDGEAVPSLAGLLAGAEWTNRAFRVDWSIDPASFDRISATDLIEGRIDPRRIAGKSVIVGAGQSSELVQVPAHGMVSGAILQAVAAETLLQGRALAATRLPLTALGAELLAIVLVALHGRLRAPEALITLGSLSLAVEALAVLVQVRMAVIVDTAAWHLLLLGAAAVAATSALDLKRAWPGVIRASNGDRQELVTR